MEVKKSLGTRGKIIRAGFMIFRRFGINRVRMSDIAESAGMSRSSLYRYFQNKREIVHAVLEEYTVTRSEVHKRLLCSGDDLNKKLGWVLQLKREVMQEFGDVFIEDLLADGEYTEKLNDLRESIKEDFKKLISMEQERGNISNSYSVDFIYEYLVKLQLLVMDKALQVHYKDLADLTVALMEISLRGIRG